MRAIERSAVPARRRKTLDPCPDCRAHPARCFCAHIPRLETRTRLIVVAHHRELKRTTNSGGLAVRALVNSKLFVRGAMGAPLNLSGILTPAYESVILYPSDDAVDLADMVFDRPVQMIVADGNWRQAGKVHRRHPELAHLRRVKISAVNRGTQHLRREHFAEGFSTLEAIAIAYGHLEGPEIARALRDLYRIKLQTIIEGRGLTFEG